MVHSKLPIQVSFGSAEVSSSTDHEYSWKAEENSKVFFQTSHAYLINAVSQGW
jgi:hypothetical protein